MVITSFYKNLLLQFLDMFYQGGQMQRLQIYNLYFQCCIFPPMDNLPFFDSFVAVHDVCLNYKFLVARFDNISLILCAAVAYMHINPFVIFMKSVKRQHMQIQELKELHCNVCNDCVTIRRVKPNDFRVALTFYMTRARVLDDKLILLKPLRFRACSYSPLDGLKTSLFEEFLDDLSLLILDNWLTICGEWLELLFIYNGGSLYIWFFIGFTCAIIQIKCYVKKSTTFELVSMSILNPTSLNILIMFLRVQFICYPFTLLRITKPSSL